MWEWGHLRAINNMSNFTSSINSTFWPNSSLSHICLHWQSSCVQNKMYSHILFGWHSQKAMPCGWMAGMCVLLCLPNGGDEHQMPCTPGCSPSLLSQREMSQKNTENSTTWAHSTFLVMKWNHTCDFDMTQLKMLWTALIPMTYNKRSLTCHSNWI